MSFFFGRTRARTNTTDLAKQARDHVTKLEGPQGAAKAEELAKVLAQMKQILQGTHDAEPNPDHIYQLVTSLIDEDLLYLLAVHLHRLPFESRKDTQVIFSYVFRFRPQPPPKPEPFALAYVVERRPQVLVELCRVLKNEAAAAVILYDDGDEPGEREGFFEWIDKSSFEVSADAFTTFRELITKHKDLVPRYLAVNFDLFFNHYNTTLVQSNSYVTKRQSIKLLGEILLDRANYSVMTAYVDRGEHLKICMNLLRDDRKMVQYEGFHVFKVFVANPHKSLPVQKILIMNREKLLHFLSHFLEDRTDDEQFIDEREFLIKQIRNMPAQPVVPQGR
ncbi:Hym1p [Collariella sp. IMI 366227]|nr:Hym1p [Collariella sp. IMI 366227]